MSQGRPLMEQFNDIIDPRQHGKIRFSLQHILVMAVCSILCGCDNYKHMEMFVRLQSDWFRKFLDVEELPTRYTFRRIFMLLDAAAFEKRFTEWTAESFGALQQGEQVCLDGKTVRGSRTKKEKGVHLVSAWASKAGYVFGQLKTEDKSNEIKAIPQLLDLLLIKGCIVSTDAMGCQRDIATTIVEKGADYLFSLKGNQSALHDNISLFFRDTIANGNPDYPLKSFTTTDGDHGRIESRTIYTSSDIGWLDEKTKWDSLKTIACIRSTREIDGIASHENRYFITSLCDSPKELLEATRRHWGIENSLHWHLDVSFNEDSCLIRHRNAARVFSVLRKLCLNSLKAHKVKDYSIKGRRMIAGWDPIYREKVLTS